jgi:hypothetical protein
MSLLLNFIYCQSEEKVLVCILPAFGDQYFSKFKQCITTFEIRNPSVSLKTVTEDTKTKSYQKLKKL